MSDSTGSRFSAAAKRGLKVFGVFVGIAVVFYVVTFGPYKNKDAEDLPLPTWVMLIPTVASLGAGLVAGVVVAAVDFVRGRRRRSD